MTDRPPLVIAEAGVNHNGSRARARDMVAAAAAAGADAVKFQTFRADLLTTARARKAAYQETATGRDGSQADMLRELELPRKNFVELADACRDAGVEFMSTAFDPDSLSFLVRETGLKRVKIPSGEMVNPVLLLAAARTGLPVIVSTGLATMEEVGDALGVLAFGMVEPARWPTRADAHDALNSPEGQDALAARVSLLHCVTDYPARPADMNLLAMHTLEKASGLPFGLSDHSEGIAISLAAVALGASVIEKHFTLDKALPGPDHAASLSPDELTALVSGIAAVHAALGTGDKAPTAAELNNLHAARGSLVASAPIAVGTPLGPENVSVKRPGDGLTPMRLLDIAGTPAARDYAEDEQIDPPAGT